jgi:class 3 adenylate cyclase
MDQPCCVLVSDMAGFTKQTRLHGITHFASKILRMRQVLHPLILRHHPLVVETEADNFLLVFDTVRDGLLCALDMMACLTAYNRRLDVLGPEHKKNRLELGGIGLDFGHITLEAPSGHMYGNAASGAFLLGEDVSNGDILCTSRVADELAKSWPELLQSARVTLKRTEDDTLPFEHLQGHYFIVSTRSAASQISVEEQQQEYARLKEQGAGSGGGLGSLRKGTHSRRGSKTTVSLDHDDGDGTADPLWVLARQNLVEVALARERALQHQQYAWSFDDVANASFIGEECCLLTRRHELGLAPQALAVLDDSIADRFLSARDVSVLLFGLQVGLVTERRGIPTAFSLKHTILELLEPLIEAHGGRAVEDTFVVFDEPHEAVACALALAARVKQYNSEVTPEEQMQPKGFGVHSGPMLIVPSTNVHWGDCVSTASKLGEDLAEEGEVLVSDKVWEAVRRLPAFQVPSLKANLRELSTSGVNFHAFSITGHLDELLAPLPAPKRELLTEETGDVVSSRSGAAAAAVAGASTAAANASTAPAAAATLPSASPSLGSMQRTSSKDPPMLRTLTMRGGKHQLGVMDYSSSRGNPAQSHFVVPPVDLAGQPLSDAPVAIASGIVSPQLASKLLQHSSSRTEVRTRKYTIDNSTTVTAMAADGLASPGTLGAAPSASPLGTAANSRRASRRASGGPLLSAPQERRLAQYASGGSTAASPLASLRGRLSQQLIAGGAFSPKDDDLAVPTVTAFGPDVLLTPSAAGTDSPRSGRSRRASRNSRGGGDRDESPKSRSRRPSSRSRRRSRSVAAAPAATSSAAEEIGAESSPPLARSASPVLPSSSSRRATTNKNMPQHAVPVAGTEDGDPTAAEKLRLALVHSAASKQLAEEQKQQQPPTAAAATAVEPPQT